MFLEYLFFDKSKRSQVENFSSELEAHWSTAKKDDLPPKITYKDFDKTDYWIVKYEKSGSNKQVARKLSEIMLIDLTQQGGRCSNSPGEAEKQLISGVSAVEAEAELIHVALQMNTSAVIGSQ